MKNMLIKVREEMEVYDSTGDKVGTVKAVQFGDEDLERPGAETTTTQSQPKAGENSLVDDFARAISSDDRSPDELLAQFERYGYLTVDAGLLRSNRYVRADQITSVSGNRVELNASHDELLKN